MSRTAAFIRLTPPPVAAAVSYYRNAVETG
jgi:hypothetical protein